MTSRSLALAALLAVASLAQAADAKTYPIVFQDAWQAGDVVTRQSTETETTDVVVKGPDGAVFQENKGTQTTTYRVVVKCLEVDGTTPTKRILYFPSWSLEAKGGQGDVKDESLSGCHVEVTGKGAARAWKVLTPGKEASEVASQWLTQKFGSGASDGNERLLEPQEPQAPGSTWTPDVVALAKALGGTLEVDPAKSSMKLTFLEVQTTPAGEFGKFTMDMDFQTKALPSPMGVMPWKEGGLMKGRGVMLRSLAPRGFDEEKAMEMTISGIAEAQGALVHFAYKAVGKDAQAAGGEMPPVPTAAATTPAPAPVPAPVGPK